MRELNELGFAVHDGYAKRAPRKRNTNKPQKTARLKRLYEAEGTLYTHIGIEYHEYMTRHELEAEGHMSPDRIPPNELADAVRWGDR